MNNILTYIESNKARYEDELKEFLRIPSISTEHEHNADTRRAAEFVRDELQRMGMNNVAIYETARHPVVYGERRLRAAALAGIETVPCDIAEHTDDDLIEIGLAENIQRRDLNPIEEANAFQHFIDQRGYSIRRLAERIGKDKSYLEGRLALLRAPDDVQTLVAQRPDTLDAARQLEARR